MKKDDKPIWGPVARLMVSIGVPFHPWPLHPQGPLRPTGGAVTGFPTGGAVTGFPARVPANRRVSANDEDFTPPPECA